MTPNMALIMYQAPHVPVLHLKCHVELLAIEYVPTYIVVHVLYFGACKGMELEVVCVCS